MNKKKCPQCKNLIPIKAPTCLFCGRPNKFVTNDYINRRWNKDNSEIKFYNILKFKYLLFIFIFLIVIVIIKSF